MASSGPLKRMRTDTDATNHHDVLEIDRKGDLVLKVGPGDGVLMRVSSKHLVAVSKVFEAMLGPHFAEGRVEHDTSNPLNLPDDDPRAFELMCRLSLGQVSDISETQPAKLTGLAIIADKYDCLRSVRIVAQSCLIRWITDHEKSINKRITKHEGLGLLDAFALAYISEDRKAFKKISHLIMTIATGSQIDGTLHAGLSDVFPVSFQANLLAEWTATMQRVQLFISQSALRFYCDKRCIRYHGAPCPESMRRFGHIMYELGREGHVAGQPVSKTCNKAEYIGIARHRIDQAIQAIGHCREKAACTYCSLDFLWEFDEMGRKLKAEIGYMCLDCVKSGEFGARKGGCKRHKA